MQLALQSDDGALLGRRAVGLGFLPPRHCQPRDAPGVGSSGCAVRAESFEELLRVDRARRVAVDLVKELRQRALREGDVQVY